MRLILRRVQAARDHVSALMSTCSTAIQKEEKLAQAALSKAASQHEAKVRQHEQRLQDAHAAYQAAVAAEWAELQQTITSQAKTLQVRSCKSSALVRRCCPASAHA